jgi:N-acetylglucosaminyldiphosphoundecaprenol N-acetyl-beta-D-mannosaminyltransferase
MRIVHQCRQQKTCIFIYGEIAGSSKRYFCSGNDTRSRTLAQPGLQEIKMPKFALYDLIGKICRIQNEGALAALFSNLKACEITKPVRIAFVNAHAVNISHINQEFLRNLVESDYVFRDGSGMKILLKMLRKDAGLNLNGTDLIPQLMAIYREKSAALLGTQEPYLRKAATVAAEKGLNPVLSMDGFREDKEYLEAVRDCRPFLIILGMGMPKQERVASLLARNLDYPCIIICGGAILDFMAGKVPRAPLIFRRTGLEWLYRLMREPRRLFTRYVIGNFLFLIRSLRLALLFNQKISLLE